MHLHACWSSKSLSHIMLVNEYLKKKPKEEAPAMGGYQMLSMMLGSMGLMMKVCCCILFFLCMFQCDAMCTKTSDCNVYTTQEQTVQLGVSLPLHQFLDERQAR